MKKPKTIQDAMDNLGCCYYDLVLEQLVDTMHLAKNKIQYKMNLGGDEVVTAIRIDTKDRIINDKNILFHVDLLKIKADVKELMFSSSFEQAKKKKVSDVFKGVREFVQVHIRGFEADTNNLIYTNSIPFVKLMFPADELVDEFCTIISEEVDNALDRTLDCYINKGVEYHSNYVMMQHSVPDVDGLLQQILKK